MCQLTKVHHSLQVPVNGSRDDWLPKSGESYSQCQMYVEAENRSRGVQDCVNGYEFHFDNANEWNVVSEWGLVCSRKYVAPLITTVYFSGVMIGGLIFGSLSDST